MWKDCGLSHEMKYSLVTTYWEQVGGAMSKRLPIEVVEWLQSVYMKPHNQELFAKAMKISARCHHPSLVEFIGVVPDHPAIIVMELMDCTLRAALVNNSNHIHPICMNVAQGLLYLHSIQPHPLIHRDVSAPTVLLKAAGNG